MANNSVAAAPETKVDENLENPEYNKLVEVFNAIYATKLSKVEDILDYIKTLVTETNKTLEEEVNILQDVVKAVGNDLSQEMSEITETVNDMQTCRDDFYAKEKNLTDMFIKMFSAYLPEETKK